MRKLHTIRVNSKELKEIKKVIRKNKTTQQEFFESSIKNLKIKEVYPPVFLNFFNKNAEEINDLLVKISRYAKGTEEFQLSTLIELQRKLDIFLKIGFFPQLLDENLGYAKKLDEQKKVTVALSRGKKREKTIGVRLGEVENIKLSETLGSLKISKRNLFLLLLKGEEIGVLDKEMKVNLFDFASNLGRLKGNLVTIKKSNSSSEIDMLLDKSTIAIHCIRLFIDFARYFKNYI